MQIRFSRKTRKQIEEVKKLAARVLFLILSLIVLAHTSIVLAVLVGTVGIFLIGFMTGRARNSKSRKVTRTRKQPHVNPSKSTTA